MTGHSDWFVCEREQSTGKSDNNCAFILFLILFFQIFLGPDERHCIQVATPLYSGNVLEIHFLHRVLIGLFQVNRFEVDEITCAV